MMMMMMSMALMMMMMMVMIGDDDIHGIDEDDDDDLVEYEANGESPHWPKRVNGADRAVPLLYRHSHLM